MTNNKAKLFNKKNKPLLILATIACCTFAANENAPSQSPLFVSQSVPPLNMLVMGRDHKLYYEAYNDASDLNNDGVIDTGYKGYLSTESGGITYYGYFNSNVCYTYSNGLFTPAAYTSNKKCTGQWSGDFLNYLTTSRMDALRKVLYGGYRDVDSTTETVLQGAFIPQDAHTWGKEYFSLSNDGYLISDYTPLSQPVAGYRHLFAVVSLTDGGIPQLRTLTNNSLRVWNWVSKERPVAGTTCNNGSDLTCTNAGPSNSWSIVPTANLSNLKITTWKDSKSTATDKASMDDLFNNYSDSNSKCGSGAAAFTNINSISNFQNPYNGHGCGQDGYHTLIEGILTPSTTGSYSFSVDGDDAVDFLINDSLAASYYGDHGAQNKGGIGTIYSKDLLAGNPYSIKFRHEENGGNASFYLYWRTPDSPVSEMKDYSVRVSVCPSDASLRDSNCVAYSGNNYKPTGILHDYGATDRMFFGLMSGSYSKNVSGGVLRTKLQSFSKEYNPTTGQFCFKSGANCSNTASLSNGIVYTIDQLRIIDFNYSSQSYGCGWITTRPISQTDSCYMWGNPIGEMMYETMRYFAGATTPTSSYDYSSGKDSQSPLSLPKINTWTPPYKASGNPDGYASCAAPVMTVISDINPSYDYKLPGGHWTSSVSNTGNPASIANLNVSTEADKIWTAEGGGSKSIFIGESNDIADSAPTPKTVNTLSKIRGLSPEEPSKQGTYYSAAIANFGSNNAIGGDKKLMTYSVALASPLPSFTMHVGGSTVTIVPFAKSVGGSSIDILSNFQPTDQIVDYYVESIANTDPSCSTATPSATKCDPLINGGRPKAKFRINYEDVEQGADHDMDAIVLYEISVNSSQQLVINMTSEYAAGSIDQHMGYIISGTTKDGIYLEVKDQGGADIAYKLDTPDGKWAGECASGGCSALSRLSSSRIFTPSGASSANILKNPLWYAAKYGIPGRNTSTVSGDPSNYLLVTNALTLKDQLSKAFSDIAQSNRSITSPVVKPVFNSDGVRVGFNIYRTDYNVKNWSGNLFKESFDSTTKTSTRLWDSASQITYSSTRAKMANTSSDGLLPFSWSNLSGREYAGINLQDALNTTPYNSNNIKDNLGQSRVDFILGQANSSFRARDSLLGDIINSSPVFVGGAQYLSYIADQLDHGYSNFSNTIKTRVPHIYVGANDGALHSFSIADGKEAFAFIPTAVIPNLNKLTSPNYNEQGGEHQFFVDGTPIVRDVYIDKGNGKEWRTVLIGTLRAGGRSLFALDITDPASVRLLWEFSEGDDLKSTRLWDTNDVIETGAKSDIGYSFPVPAVTRLNEGTHLGNWVVVTGNGYDSASGRSVLFIIDIATGKFKKIPTAKTDSLNGLSSVKLADSNRDGKADYAYAGDLQGNLWRFDLIKTGDQGTLSTAKAAVEFSDLKVSFSGSITNENDPPKPLFVAKDSNNKRQPITTAPSITNHPKQVGYIVTLGTGRYFQLADRDNKDVQSVYGIWDRYTAGQDTSSITPAITRTDLQAQTIQEQNQASFVYGQRTSSYTIRILSQNTLNWSQQSGWVLDLKLLNGTAEGERVIDEMALRGQVLFFNTRSSNADPCTAGITGWTYGINPHTGGRTYFDVFDFNQDSLTDSADSYNGKIVSGFQSPAGGFNLSESTLFTTDGTATKISFGPNSFGRQTWHAMPQETQ